MKKVEPSDSDANSHASDEHTDTHSNSDSRLLAQRCASHLLEHDACSNHLGIQVIDVDAGRATMRMTVVEFMLNGHKTCHGGMIFMLADSAFAFACNSRNHLTVAAGADVNFVAPAYLGDVLTAYAEEQSLSGRTGVYDARVVDQNDKLIAHFRGRSHRLRQSLLNEPQ